MHYKKRLFALMLAACLLVSILPLTALAEEPVYYCGLHEHSDACCRPLLVCHEGGHVHEDSCYSDQYTERFCGQEADHTHVDGCRVKPQDTCDEKETCGAAQHTDSCLKGLAEKAAAESAARMKSAQDLIDALPDTVTEETRTEVEAQLAAIHAIQVTMTDGEREQLNLTRWENIQAALEVLDGQKDAGNPDAVTDPAAKIGDTPYATLEEALAYAKANSGSVIVLQKDLTLSSWDAVNMSSVSFTLDGNGKTISGLTEPLFEYIGWGGATVTIQNLTLSAPAVSGYAEPNLGASAALAAYVGTSNLVTISNCHVSGGSVTSGSYTGALVGFAESGGLNIVGCSVTGAALTGSNATGSFIGNSYASGQISGSASGNAIACSDESYGRSDKAGILVGRMQGGAAHTVSATVDGSNRLNPPGTNTQRVFGSVRDSSAVISGGSYPANPLLVDAGSAPTVAAASQLTEKDGSWVAEKKPAVAAIGSTEYYDLKDALEAAKAANGSTIVLQSDVTLDNWDAVNMSGVSFTLDGNGKTISGLTEPLFEYIGWGGVTVAIQDLTLSAPVISGYAEPQVGASAALAAYVGTSNLVTISNCHVSGGSVASSSFAGGLVGYAETGLNIQGCSVTSMTVTSTNTGDASATGAMVGYSNGSISVSGTVGGNTINSAAGSGWQGSVIGVLNAQSGNAVSVTEASRSNSSNDLYVIGGLLANVTYTGGSYYTDPTESGDNQWNNGSVASPENGHAFVKNSSGIYGLDALPQSGDITDKKTSKSISITWDDGSNSSGLRPAQVTITLYANGVQVGDALTVTKQDGDIWNLEIQDLDKYSTASKTRAPGTPTEVVYTVKQGDVSGYTTSYSADTLTITNELKPKTAYVYSEHKLMQTGAEILSAGLMALAGIFALAAAVWFMRKKSYER